MTSSVAHTRRLWAHPCLFNRAISVGPCSRRSFSAKSHVQYRTLRTRSQKPRAGTGDALTQDSRASFNEEEALVHARVDGPDTSSFRAAGTSGPVKTWKGLKRITTSEWDERQAQTYTGFNAPAKETVTPQEVRMCTQRAITEALYLRQYGKSLETSQIEENERLSDEQIANAHFYNTGGAYHMSLEHVDAAKSHSSETISCGKIPLLDPDLKFAVLKRSSQLLGRRVPDPLIDSIQTVTDLMRVLSQSQRDPKLENTVAQDEEILKLQNLYWGKETQDDKDRQHGSLKVLEEELRKVRLMTPEQREWALGS